MKTNKKTKIVCTIGPATENEKTMAELVASGMNVMRLNFSHGDFAEHQARVNIARKVSKKLNTPIAILQDLGGPKIRIGDFEKGSIILKEGQEFILSINKVLGNEKKVYINYSNLAKEVKIGGFILLHDGKKRLQITDIKGGDIYTKVIIGGEIKSRRGVNVPGANLSISSITEKDKKDVDFAIKNNLDFVALSFVRKPDDIVELRAILKKKNSNAGIIAKIETPEAVANIDKIIELSDGIMIARGDLAIEIDPEHVPLVQKMIIKKCNLLGKPVITATQMLESMIHSSVPTRAEVSDVANAILDGTDAIMLSEETTLGEYPTEAVSMMSKIARKIEDDNLHKKLSFSRREISDKSKSITDSVCDEVIDVARNVGAKFIVALTMNGKTARMISRYKPEQKILAFTPDKTSCEKIVLSFGCFPFLVKEFKTIAEAVGVVKKILNSEKLVRMGDKVVIVGGIPFGSGKGTNMMLVEEV